MALILLGGPAAHASAPIHGAGNGILAIAKGTLPPAPFGTAGHARRPGRLDPPRGALQATAPLVFGAALTAWDTAAVWLAARLGAASFLVLGRSSAGGRRSRSGLP